MVFYVLMGSVLLLYLCLLVTYNLSPLNHKSIHNMAIWQVYVNVLLLGKSGKIFVVKWWFHKRF